MKTLQEIADDLNKEGYLGITDWEIDPNVNPRHEKYYLEGKKLRSASAKPFTTFPGSEQFFEALCQASMRNCGQLPTVNSPTLFQYPRLWHPWYSPYCAEFVIEIAGKGEGRRKMKYEIARLPTGEITTYAYDGILPGHRRRMYRGSSGDPEWIHMFVRRLPDADGKISEWEDGKDHLEL